MMSNRKPRRRKPAAMTDKWADKVIKDYLARKAVMTRKQMFEYEDAVRKSNLADDWFQARRVALAVVSMPAKHLMRGIEKDRATALAMACAHEIVMNYSNVLKQLSELVAEADRRLMIALCGRSDMVEIIDEARRQNEATEALPSGRAVQGALLQAAAEKITRGKLRLVVSNER